MRRSRRAFLRDTLAITALGVAAPRRLVSSASAGPGTASTPAPGRLTTYPDDAFSRPLEDRWLTFETAVGCAPAGDVVARAQQFAENSLRLAERDGRPVTRWRFRSRGTSRAVLVVDERIRRRPDALSVRVRNESAETVRVGMDLHELAWRPGRDLDAFPWTLGSSQEVPPGEERILRFAFDAVHWPGRTHPPAPRFPLGAVLLTVDGIRPEVPCELVLGELTVHYPPAAGIRDAAVRCPAVLRAGERCVFHVSCSGAGAASLLDLEVRRGEWVVWRMRLSPEERARLSQGRCEVRRVVPTHVAPGGVTVGLVADGYRASGGEAHARLVNRARPRLPKAERRPHRGCPTFFLNGKPRAWQGYSSYDFQPGNVSQFGAHGANVFCIPCCAGRHVHHHAASPTWVAPDRFDFGQIDERAGMALQANPEAVLFLRVSLALPAFWTQEHEDELVRVHTDLGTLVWEEGNATRAVSLASEVWRRDQERALRALLRYCQQQPWASRVAGFWLTSEVTEEWFAWGCNDGQYADYSAPGQRAFARWLGERGLPGSEEPAPVPLPQTRRCPGRDLYPDSPQGRRAALYHRFLSELTADGIAHFARIVKEETGGRSLVGAFYGYVIQLAGEPRQALSGHFALRRLLDDPNVDFLAGIPLHDFRYLAGGYSAYVSATESIRTAGKLYCNENDLFSWLHHYIWYTEYDPKDPRGGAVSMHRRECANDAVHGAMAQKFSLAASWHYDDALQDEFARQARVYARSLTCDRTPLSQIAFVVDDTSFAWTPPESTLLAATHKQLLRAIAHTGAPVGVWLLSDLDRLPDAVRLVIVAHAPAAQADDVASLRRLLQRGGRTVVAIGPVGLVDPADGSWRPDAVADLLGLPVRVDDAPLPGAAVLASDGSEVFHLERICPRARVEGGGFLRYTDGVPAGAERALPDGGRLIWCGVPPLSTALWRQWAEAAGVHCYAPTGCFVHAARDLVSVTASEARSVRLRWPRPVTIEDLFTGWRGSGAEIDCPFQAGQTRLFRVAA